LLLFILAWAYLLTGAGMGMSAWDMTTLSLFPHKAVSEVTSTGGEMAGMGVTPRMAMPDMAAAPAPQSLAPQSPAPWSLGLWSLTIVMWWTMMVAMMVPSAAPTLLLYGRVQQRALAHGHGAELAPTWAFAAGYLLVWLGFSVVAAGLHWALERSGLAPSAMMGSQSKWLSAGVLAAAGLYQLSPLQNICLDHCRNPAQFLARHWRPRALGAVKLGALHGAYCVGCCWMLMGLLFVGGVMNLAWIAALALLVLAEKVLPGGRWIARGGAVVLLTWAGTTLLV